MMYCFPASATVTTSTMQALPIMTPSIVRVARILLLRRASHASPQVSASRISKFISPLYIPDSMRSPSRDSQMSSIRKPGVKVAARSHERNPETLRRSFFQLFQPRPRLTSPRLQPQAPRGIVRRLPRACPALRRAVQASLGRPRGKASRFDPACSRDRISSTSPHFKSDPESTKARPDKMRVAGRLAFTWPQRQSPTANPRDDFLLQRIPRLQDKVPYDLALPPERAGIRSRPDPFFEAF